MSDLLIPANARVQILYTLLTPEERAGGLPEETRRVPYQIRAKGVLIEAARVGEEVRVRTPAGRELQGVLAVVEPADEHSFGRPHPALVQIAEDIARLRDELSR